MFPTTPVLLMPTSTLRTLGRAARLFGLGAALVGTAHAQQADGFRDPATDEVMPGAVASPAALQPQEAPPSFGGSNLTLVGRLATGETRGLALSGSTLFRSNGGYLEALDVTTPTAPSVLGRFLVETAVVQGVTLDGTRAYVSAARGTPYATRGSLRIVDGSNPAAMPQLGAVTGRSFYDVAVSGNTVYGATAGGGLRLFDVTNPAAPTALGFLTVSGGSVLSVALSGQTAFVAAGNAGLAAINVSNTATPTLQGSVSVGGFATRVALQGTRAYVSVNDVGLVVVDVTNPAAPAVLGTFAIASGQIRSVAVSGTTAYVGKDDGFVVVDVTNPAAMTQLGVLNFGVSGSGQYIALSGTTAYVGNRYDGVRVVNVAAPASPQLVQLIDNGGFSFKVNVIGNTAYVADLLGQLRLIDLTNPSAPAHLGRVRGLLNADGVDVTGAVAYVAQRNDGGTALTRVDVSNPLAPTILSQHSTGGSGFGIDVVGTTAYVANGYGTADGSLVSADVSTGLSILDDVSPTNQAFDVRVEGNRAYVATFGSGLKVVDVTNPSNMTLLTTGTVGAFASSLEVAGSTVYMADSEAGMARALSVIDASNPAAPVLLDTGDGIAGGTSVDAAYAGGFAYATVDFVGLYQYDVANPSNVTQTAAVTTSDRATGVDAEGDLVVVVDAGAGVWVFREGTLTGAEAAPASFRATAGPNPFRAEASVRYFLPTSEAVALEVFNVLGARVAHVDLGAQPAGWNAVPVDGRGLAEGVYLYRLTAGSHTATGRLTLAR